MNAELSGRGLAGSQRPGGQPPHPLPTRRFLPLLALWLAAAPWLLFPQQRPILTAISATLLLVIWLFGWRRHVAFQFDLDGYVLVFLGLTGLAFLVSPLPEVSLPKLLAILLGVSGFLLVRAWLSEPAQLRHLIRALALAGGLIAFLGLFTLEWPQRQVLDMQFITGRLPHLSGDFSVNFNEMAGTLLLLLPFAWVGVRARSDDAAGRGWRLLTLASLLLIVLVLLLTQSRGAFLGLLAAGLAGYFWGRFALWRLLLLLFLAVCLLLLVALILDWGSTDLFTWLGEVDANSKTGVVTTSSWLSRLEIWRNAGQMLRDYPVLGAGLYTFEPVSRANYVYELSPPMLAITHPHNLFLEAGTSLGWSGLLLLFLFWAYLFYRLWGAAGDNRSSVARPAAVFGASLAGYLAFNLFDTITLGQKPGVLVWLVLAGSIALIQWADWVAPAKRRPAWTGLGPLLPVLFLAGLALSPLMTRNQANLALDRARFGSGEAAALQAEQFDGDSRRQGLLAFLAGQPPEAVAYWQADPQAALFLANQGHVAADDGRLADALAWYELALAFDAESSLVHYWRAEVYEAQGLVAQALESYKKSISFIPGDDINTESQAWIYFGWGQVLAQQAQWAAAAQAYEQAIGLRSDLGYFYSSLGDVLTQLGDSTRAAAAYANAKAADAGR